MRKWKWQIIFASGLVFLSAILYWTHYTIFHDTHHIFIYLLGDIAFVPIEVLMVTLIIQRLLKIREKRALLEKLNMIVGIFFSEMGTKLLTYLSDLDPELDKIREEFTTIDEWTNNEFSRVSKVLQNYNYVIIIDKLDLEYLRRFFLKERSFLVRLLENPSLLEHESFTHLLRSVFHFAEELSSRKKVSQLPKTDLEHLANDIKRVYTQLVQQWLDYMKYLKNNYSFLFSFSMRTNPFNQEASPIIQ